MASIYFSPTLWQYKFRKFSYLMASLLAYVRLYIEVKMRKIRNSNDTHIGILLAEHMGDIVATEPILKAIHAKYPQARIYWIVKQAFAPILTDHPLIDQVVIEKSVLASILLTRSHPFDVFMNLHMNELRDDPYFHVPLYNPIAEQKGITIESYYQRGNLLGAFSTLADLPIADDQPEIHINKYPKIEIDGPYWVIHRKSSNATREWNDAAWKQLIQQITEHFPVQVIEIGAANGLSFDHPKFKSFVGKTSILEMFALIRSASFFIGIDSGPTHIANAYQIPGLVLLGKYLHFEKYMPYSGAYEAGKLAHILQYPAGPPTEIPVALVWNEISKKHMHDGILI